MSIEVFCDCGKIFEADDALAGGITNCPGCGRAVDVPGLKDPLWRGAQVLGALLWAGGTAAAYQAGGLVPAAVTALVAGLVLWGISRAF